MECSDLENYSDNHSQSSARENIIDKNDKAIKCIIERMFTFLSSVHVLRFIDSISIIKNMCVMVI